MDVQQSEMDREALVDPMEAEDTRGLEVRVLLCSDVASEGINLHFHCHRLIHFDMPWSLMVFQQRNGRVDRYGQPRTPQIVYLVTESTNNTIRGDTRILEVLRHKDEQAYRNVGERRNRFEDVINAKLDEELEALERLKTRRLTQLELKLEQSSEPSAHKTHREERARRDIEEVFKDYLEWVQETMSTERTPWLKVICAMVGNG